MIANYLVLATICGAMALAIYCRKRVPPVVFAIAMALVLWAGWLVAEAIAQGGGQ